MAGKDYNHLFKLLIIGDSSQCFSLRRLSEGSRRDSPKGRERAVEAFLVGWQRGGGRGGSF